MTKWLSEIGPNFIVWKETGSPIAIPSTTLLTVFDGHAHRPHGMFPTLSICVGGKNFNIEVEIVNASLEYNLLLGQN